MLRWFGAAFVMLLAILCLRAATLGSTQPPVPAPEAQAEFDVDAMLQRLRGGLRIPTVSRQPGSGMDEQAFGAFRAHLARHYPRVHEQLELEIISRHSLLFRWPGQDQSLPATVLLAHQDVVPVDTGSEGEWVHPPYEAVVDGGYIWARGALDDKFGLFSILEAAEALVAEGFDPRRTLYLAFGHDEEVGGGDGAVKIARLFADRGWPVGLVLDEGGAIAQGMVPGLDAPVALVGVAEKGYLSLLLKVSGMGGHSSAPPEQSAIGILAAAVVQLEENRFPMRFDGATRAFFEQGIGPASSFGMRLVYGNLWLFEPLLLAVLDRSPLMASMVRTTTAPTLFHAGLKDNVLPATAQATVNFRLLPGETADSVLAQVREIVADDRVEISLSGHVSEASPSSRIGSPPWQTLATTIREVFPEVIVAPYLLLGGTDSRYFRDLCDCVYRFLPIALEPDGLRRAHGTNERIPLSGLENGARFYRRLIKNADAAGWETGPEA
ncbi:MAG: M20 family peptidase [Myxococcota bacterium]|nr:M20 family peptidase [Myxococcota bacterium]